MKFVLKTGDIISHKTACLIVGVYEQGHLTPSAKALDKISHGYLSEFLKSGEFQGRPGQTLVLYSVPHLAAERILLIGCGKMKPMNEKNFRKAAASIVKALQQSKAKNAISCLTEVDVAHRDLVWKTKHFVEACHDAVYRFDQFKSEKEPAFSLQEITLLVREKKLLSRCEEALKQGSAIADGVEFTKNLANLPPNICTPTYIANEALRLAKKYKNLKVKILNERDMEKLGMGALLAVARGSIQDAKLICLEYVPSGKKTKTVALVGKGITFDTGGISLKPSEGMVGMKYDMCGAATVLGTIKAAAELKLPVHLVGVIASAENMPSGTADKPEDIVTTMSGQTVEILNTDAEGRLVLCDALTYCERYKPDVVIDIATLTGAVVIALGYHASGLLSNNDKLAKKLLEAGTESADRAWQLPLWEDYQEQLKSPFADMANVGGRTAGTITAACFLSRFAKKFPWAHLDVAGTAAMMGGVDRYATGRPVPMLMQYLINECG